MSNFEGTPHSRIALGVALETMHLHIAQTGLFLGELCNSSLDAEH